MKKEEKIIEKAAPDFCNRCINKDTRILQDRLNLAVITINEITEVLNIDSSSFEGKCKEVRKYARRKKELSLPKDKGKKNKTRSNK